MTNKELEEIERENKMEGGGGAVEELTRALRAAWKRLEQVEQPELCANDTEKIDWLEGKDGWALISDDFGRWALSGDGMQNIPDNPDVPNDIETAFYVPKEQWHTSIREAIDAAISAETAS